MGTYNGKDENLKFSCGQCYDESIEIDLYDDNDMRKLWGWLGTHSAEGGRYTNVKIKLDISEDTKLLIMKRIETLNKFERLTSKDLRKLLFGD